MKKIMMGILVAICAIACNKFNSEVPSSSVDGIKFNLNATPASLSDKSRATLGDDNKWSWKAGDRIWVCHPNNTAGKGEIIFTYQEDGSFSSEAIGTWGEDISAEVGLTTWVAFYPYDGIEKEDVMNGIFLEPIVPTTQNGTMECVGENFFMYCVNAYTKTKDVLDISYEEASKSVNVKAKFTGCTMPIVKFNVPESLGATEIVLSGIDASENPSVVAGTMRMFKTTNPRDNIGKETNPNFKSISPEYSVTVSREGAVISGDVYVLLQSDVMYDAAAGHTNSAVKLKFDITTEDGSISGTKKLNTTLTGGIITDLGTINPAAGPQLKTPTISYDLESGKVVASTEDDGCTLYYCVKDTPSKPDNYQEIPDGGFDFVKGAVNYIHVKSSKSGYQNGVAQAVIKHWSGSAASPSGRSFSQGESKPIAEGSWLYVDAKNDITVSSAYIVFTKTNQSIKDHSGDLVFNASSTGIGSMYLNTGSSKRTVYVAKNENAGTKVGTNTDGGFDKMDDISIIEGDSIRTYFNSSSNLLELLWFETGSFTVLESANQDLNSPGFNNNGGQNL